MTDMKRKTLWLTAAACLLALLIGLTCCSPKKAAPGSSAPEQKTVTIEVIHKDKTQKEFQILSAAEYLGDALVAEGLVKGTTGDYGLYIDTVDNETADKSKEEWWCITKGGQAVMTGISTTPFADGDTFELTLTVGY